ncbi:MAG: ABC transporter permease [Bryobacteraceae bacterium]|nr:ABC transporter permease [Bryobacteraceae bacterium]
MRKTWGRGRFEREMAEEMEFHLAARAADLELQGLPAQEARRRARLEFGGVAKYQEGARESVWLHWLDQAGSDLRLVMRSLARSPLFAGVAVLTLALGIGANAVLFSVVDGVLLKPLPYPHGDRLYAAREVVPAFAKLYPDVPVNARHFAEWQQQCASCEAMALVAGRAMNLSGAGAPRRVSGLSTSAEWFDLLGLKLQLGRAYTRQEAQPEANHVIVISDAMWRSNFGADSGVIGRTVYCDSAPVRIIGVLAPQARQPRREELGAVTSLPDEIEVLRPMGLDLRQMNVTGIHNFSVLIRLKPGRSPSQAMAELSRATAALIPAGSFEAGISVRLLHLQTRMSEALREPLLLLLGAAGALLLIVCLNLGNLMLARAASRQRDWAVRAALGARGSDLFRQVWIEAGLLVAAGTALGGALAWEGLSLLRRFAPAGFPRLEDVSLDLRVVGFMLLLAALAAGFASGVPVWRLRRTQPQEALRAGNERNSETNGERRARRALVCAEVGLSLVLASVGGFLLVSFVKVMGVDKGFAPEERLTFEVALSGDQYKKGPQRNQFYAEFLERLRSLPGVTGAGLTSYLPLQGEMWVSGIRRRKSDESLQVNVRAVSPGYMAAMGMKLRGGREFEEGDRQVIVVSEQTAKALFLGEDPLGQEIPAPEGGGVVKVIGVVNEVKTTGLEAAAPLTAYLPYWVRSSPQAAFVVRGSGGEAALTSGVRAALSAQDREIPLHRPAMMATIVEAALATRRLETWVAAAFALAGLGLACLGVFGVVSYGVTQRTSEFGIRMALGATSGEVLRLVLRETAGLLAVGVAVGVAGALVVSRWLAAQLYGVSARDPLVLLAVVATVCGVALVASYWPARRAADLDPMRALRQE